jgi:hypothetical protein
LAGLRIKNLGFDDQGKTRGARLFAFHELKSITRVPYRETSTLVHLLTVACARGFYLVLLNLTERIALPLHTTSIPVIHT